MKPLSSINSIIQVDGLSKRFGNLQAVDNLTFTVNEGEIFGFLGPNGAGKTTTIRMLTGLSQPTSGKASILGYDIKTQTVQAKKYIGIVPDASNLYDDLTAFENLLFMGELYGVAAAKRQAKAEYLLKSFRLEERKNSLFRVFSRGMKRALTIAAALMHDPKILFLDEPTIGLDIFAARSLRALILNLKRQGITIFLMTHHLEEADILCDRIAIIVNGKIVTIDTPQALKAQLKDNMEIEFILEKSAESLAKDLVYTFSQASVLTPENNCVRIVGASAPLVYAKAFEWAQKKNSQILSINTVRPTLEDAFIKITGLSPILMSEETIKS